MSIDRDDPLVTFRTSVNWAFNVHEGVAKSSWGGTRYRSDFAPGELLSVPRSIAEVRQADGLGQIVEESLGDRHA